jgi:NAD(P)-dependent dehydrogenase (short-subunit alcohol dehydrogenase family)
MKNAMIWGASGGIGRALTIQLIDSGWQVFAAARDLSQIPAGTARNYSFAAEDLPAIKDIAIDLAHEVNNLSLTIYAVGDLQADFLRNLIREKWTAVMDSNLTGAYLTSSHTVHLLPKGAHMMFIGAYVDHLILPKMGAYAVAKAGLETYAAVLQKEQRQLNITLVKPGAVATPFWDNAPFRMPADAKSPEMVAAAMIAHMQEGQRGVLAL